MSTDSPLKVWLERDGALLRLRLARPKANIVDAAMILALHAALSEQRKPNALRGVLLDAEGPHFSFGASVEEHLPANCAQMLASLHALLLELLEFPAPVLVAVRGQCLGGGLELALAGGPIFAPPRRSSASPRSSSGCSPRPLGIAAVPRAQPVAEDLLFSGRSISGTEALACGLVQAWPTTPKRPRWPGSSSTCRTAPPRWPAPWPPRAARCCVTCGGGSAKSSSCTWIG